MKPRDEFFDRANRYSLGIDDESGRFYLSLPVSNGVVDYEEYYELTGDRNSELLADPVSAVAFAEECRRREHDDLMMQQPGSNRGTPV